MIAHIVYDQPPKSRRERAESVKKRYRFTRHQGTAKQVLEALQEKYGDVGITRVLLPKYTHK